jgi:hypothetical protein
LPGIGKILAMTIQLEAAEISRFTERKHFASYCRPVAAIKPATATAAQIRT